MAEAVNEKKAKIKKPSKFFKEVKSELKKVVWPSGKQVINNTLIVLALVILFTVWTRCSSLDCSNL